MSDPKRSCNLGQLLKEAEMNVCWIVFCHEVRFDAALLTMSLTICVVEVDDRSSSVEKIKS